MTEYGRESQSLTKYHITAQKCPLKPETNKYSNQGRDTVPRNSGLGTCGIQQAEVGQAVGTTDIKEAWSRPMQFSYTNIRSKKAKFTHERNPDKHSLEAVGILKQATDKEYMYLIYKINNPQLNREPDYIFKSSTPMAQMATDMDQDGPEHPLQGEEAYLMAVIHNACHITLAFNL